MLSLLAAIVHTHIDDEDNLCSHFQRLGEGLHSPVPNTDEVEDVEGHSTCELGVASMTADGVS